MLQSAQIEAEDLVQEVFSRFYKETKKEIQFENPRAWLYKVLLNLSVSQNKLRDLHRQYVDNRMNVDFETRYEPDFFSSERQEIVFSVIESMEEKDRLLLTLYHNGLSYNEIAEIMKINPASVGKTLVRVIEKLKKKLKLDYHEMFE
jgi:RNA polymerase sigma-70 factor (ECF subfamily)